jgi:hypothetical protein
MSVLACPPFGRSGVKSGEMGLMVPMCRLFIRTWINSKSKPVIPLLNFLSEPRLREYLPDIDKMAIIKAKDGTSDPILTRLVEEDKVPWYKKPNLRMMYFWLFLCCMGVEMTSGFDSQLINTLQFSPMFNKCALRYKYLRDTREAYIYQILEMVTLTKTVIGPLGQLSSDSSPPATSSDPFSQSPLPLIAISAGVEGGVLWPDL